jgi:uncharacterized protein
MMHTIKARALAPLALLLLLGQRVQAEPTNAASRDCLWRVQSASNCVYLLGSVHLLKAENYPLSVAINKAYYDSRILVLETDLGKAQDTAAQMAILSKGMYGGSNTLVGTLSPATYAMAKQRTKEMGLDMALFDHFKPWYFVMVLTVAKLQALGFNPMDGLDWHFFRRARSEEKQVIGLETLDYQLNLFETISPADQDLLVQQSLKDFDVIEKDMDRILRAWQTGDVEELEKTLLKSFKEYPRIYETFVARRNRNWMPRIESFLKGTDNYMVVVGAGHLAGKDSLIRMLQKQGYKVEQL